MRLHLTPDTENRLRELITPNTDRGEPLAIAWLRYASDASIDVIVVVKSLPLPDYAYVLGDDGANFDVTWLVAEASRAAAENAGIALVHLHAHRGRPRFSTVDQRTNRTIIRKLAHMDPTVPYVAVLFSRDAAIAQLEDLNGSTPIETIAVSVSPTRFNLLDVKA